MGKYPLHLIDGKTRLRLRKLLKITQMYSIGGMSKI